MATPSKSRLGRGLGSIISSGSGTKSKSDPASAATGKHPAPAASAAAPGSSPASLNALGYHEIAVALVEPSPYQPRRDFRPEQIQELADSIRAEGLLQPIVVRAAGGTYQLIAGERRWRAFQQLKLKTIPARVVQASNASAATMTLIENLQREGLNPVEEAHGFASLLRDFDLTQEQVAERVGKGRATVANSLRLLSLEAEIQGFLGTGMLSAGHAKVLLGLESKAEQVVLARRIIEQGLSVRATEDLVNGVKQSRGERTASGRRVPPAEAAAIVDIEKRLISHLNTRVQVKHTPKKGHIVIEYQGNEDLQRILEKLGVEEKS